MKKRVFGSEKSLVRKRWKGGKEQRAKRAMLRTGEELRQNL